MNRERRLVSVTLNYSDQTSETIKTEPFIYIGMPMSACLDQFFELPRRYFHSIGRVSPVLFQASYGNPGSTIRREANTAELAAQEVLDELANTKNGLTTLQKLLTRIQNEGDAHSNALATKALRCITKSK